MSNIKRLYSCSLEPKFHFYNKCTIPCLYNSNKCKGNCIQLESSSITNDTKVLSSAEILFYKKDSIEGLSLKTISNLKKEGILKIQKLYAFNFYLEFARNQNYELRSRIFNSGFAPEEHSTRIANILSSYPYCIPMFKCTSSDLVLLLTDSIFRTFRQKRKLSLELSYTEVLSISPNRVTKARKVLCKYLTKGDITYEFCKEEDQGFTND